VDAHHRRRQVQGDVEVVEALHHVAGQAARVRQQLEYPHHLDALQGETARHDQPDVARAEDHRPPARQVALEVDQPLREPCGHHAGGSVARDVDGCPGALARSERQHDRRGIDRGHPVGRREQLHPQLTRHVVHVGAAEDVDLLLQDPLEEPLGVLRAGELLTELVEPETRVDALQQDAAGLRVPVDEQDPLGAALPGAQHRGHARRAGADHHDVVAVGEVSGRVGDRHGLSLRSGERDRRRRGRRPATSRRRAW
jgi:hypothetical protein